MRHQPSLTIVGLGPAGLERLPDGVRTLLAAPEVTVVARTLEHPAAAELAIDRTVIGCDDLYEAGADFEAVYAGITERVLAAALAGPTVYAVPGSTSVGERTVPAVTAAVAAAGLSVELIPGESFIDLLYERVGLDPIAGGVQIVDGRNLPDPLPLHLPTIITQVDGPMVLANVATALGRVLRESTPVTVLGSLGSPDELVATVLLADLPRQGAGPRTSLFLDPPPAGWHGLVTTNRTLRAQCPWDREQTHHSLVSHLVEEAYETVEALSRLSPEAPGGETDFGAYAEVEEELGDLLLQVVFHATLAAETGAFDVEEVAEGIRRKLVRRHPHVFGDVEAATPRQVLTNWEHLKAEEKERESLMDDVPAALPAISRADKMQRRAAAVGFDWGDVLPVLEKLREELEELEEALADPDHAAEELGDLLFAAVNLARHLRVDAELALRRAADTFAARFREVERMAASSRRDLKDMSLEEMDGLWGRAKENESNSVSRDSGPRDTISPNRKGRE